MPWGREWLLLAPATLEEVVVFVGEVGAGPEVERVARRCLRLEVWTAESVLLGLTTVSCRTLRLI